MHWSVTCIAIAALGAAGCAGSRSATRDGGGGIRRVYALGETYRYEIRRVDSLNGAPRGGASAVSVHEVIGPAPLKERIRFEKLVVTAEGKEKDRSELIAAVPAYTVSVAPDAPKGALALPSLKGLDGSTIGMITDLHTFLVAVSPHAGMDHLARPGDAFVNPDPKVGTWSDDANVPLGQDCTQIRIELVELAAETATIETSFEPPEKPCLTLRAPWMEKPLQDRAVPNNFQQVRAGPEGYSPMWGHERFVVRSVVRRKDGRVLRATMDNELTLTVRVRCDETLEKCAGEAPVALRRRVTLTLL